MFIRLLFWFILFYSLLTFLIRVVIPVLTATKSIRSKAREMNENKDNFQSAGGASNSKEKTFTTSGTKTSRGKEDYIDFEEIK